MKEWKFIQLDDHRKVTDCLEEVQHDGWELHTYQATGRDIWIKNYLLLKDRNNH